MQFLQKSASLRIPVVCWALPSIVCIGCCCCLSPHNTTTGLTCNWLKVLNMCLKILVGAIDSSPILTMSYLPKSQLICALSVSLTGYLNRLWMVGITCKVTIKELIAIRWCQNASWCCTAYVILLIKNSRRKTKVKKVQKNKKNEKREGREDKKQDRSKKNTKSEKGEERKETGKRKKREQQQIKRKRGSKRKWLAKRPNSRCHRCGKRGHYRRECRSDAPPMVCARHYLVLKRLFSTALHRYLINIFVGFWSPFLMSFVAVIEVLRTLRFTLICPMGFMWTLLVNIVCIAATEAPF